jgi:asparagine synthase (glutamine-hydrolysing)
MCGIAGFIDFNKNSGIDFLEKMVKTMHHRGPDDNGYECIESESAVIGLGQARLSIIDLSPLGHQPMHYNELIIVFNGEIYNFKEIKSELTSLGHNFISTSDTEVILHAYKQWGKNAVNRFIGMFSIVILDREKQEIVMIRDRAGVKPFFFYWQNGLFLFGSELKAFHAHPFFKKKIDLNALRSYFDYGYVPAPYTIFKDCHKLEPGKQLRLDLNTKTISISTYWNVLDYYRKPKLDISYDEAKEHTLELLKSACRYRMVSDVPVGVFLSGGYDSSVVTAILQAGQDTALKTFTIGFADGTNEAPYAKEVAKFLGTDHTEYLCTTKEAQDIVPMLPFYYDEPFADSSAIPTTLVSQLARKQVKVALSADGGDEIFAGYDVYQQLRESNNKLNKIPPYLKNPVKKVFGLNKYMPFISDGLKYKLDGISASLNTDNFKQAIGLYRKMISLPQLYSNNLFSQEISPYIAGYHTDSTGFHNEIELALAIDYQMYLQNDIMVKVDRAAMSVSLEGREPLLDHRLIEFAAQLPMEYKLSGNKSKIILKDLVHEYLPKHMMDRPKAGFTLPINKWMQGDLKYLLDEYLSDKALAQTGLFNVKFTTSRVKMFHNKKLHYVPLIWKLLMFQMWYQKWMS